MAVGFEKDTEHSAAAFSIPNIPYVVVPYTFTSRSREQARADIEPFFDKLIKGVTTAPAPAIQGRVEEGAKLKRAERETFTGAHSFDAWEKMNEAFMEREWADGFPLIPPTPDRVEAALMAVTKDPLEVLGQLPPGNALVTVEKIAINSVMAGCRPEYLPILVTAVEAILKTPQRIFPIRTIAMSTSPHFIILLVNGPVVKKLGINYGRCTLGPGKPSRVNTVLGRAMRLIMMNVGHAYPGRGDMDSIGSAHKYSFCIAENEDASPWEPYHVERGFRKDQSTVTVLGGLDVLNVKDYNDEADALLDTFGGAAAYCSPSHYAGRLEVRGENHNMMMICPDHARILGDDGYDKRGIKEYVAAHSLTPIKRPNNEMRNRPDDVLRQWRWTVTADQNMIIPLIQDPNRIHMVVIGGPVGKSDWVRLRGQPTITTEITCAKADIGK